MEVFYKFVDHKDVVKAIAGGSLKFTQTEKLNDPAELVPLMNHDAVRSSLKEMRKRGFTKEQFKWLGCQ